MRKPPRLPAVPVPKVVIPGDSCWLLKEFDRGLKQASYFVTRGRFTTDPNTATVFRDYDDAEDEMSYLRVGLWVPPDCILEVVPLYGLIMPMSSKEKPS